MSESPPPNPPNPPLPPTTPVRPTDSCPHCEYALLGLPERTTKCPECGGALSELAFAKAAARKIARNSGARMVLIISPVVGIFASAGTLALHHGAYAAIPALLLPLWAGAARAIYVTTTAPAPRRLRRAVWLGLPLGIMYFVGLMTTTLVIVILIAWLK